MGKEELLKFCRYYKGENDCPFDDSNMSAIWFYERAWVEDIFYNRYDDKLIDEYVCVGLGLFSQFDKVPVTLKALLFNRYAKGCQSLVDAVEPFKLFYNKYYNIYD